MGTFTKPASEFYNTDVVREHIDRAAEALGRFKADDFRMEMDYRLAANDDFGNGPLTFDSPLEVVFWLWWTMATRCDGIMRTGSILKRQVYVTVADQTYCLDFVVASAIGKPEWPRIAIELDGHAFHEKTLEQVTYRNQRDRALQQAGWRIFHFSFAEFTAAPWKNIEEIFEYCKYGWRKTGPTAPE